MRGRNADVIRILLCGGKKTVKEKKKKKKPEEPFKMLSEVFPTVISVYKMGLKNKLPAEIHYSKEIAGMNGTE